MRHGREMRGDVSAVYDAIIVGSGFSGSTLGLILAKSGLRVAIIDRAKHPRFAIGESSTPTADFLLAYMADRWDLPALRPLAAWGTWLESYPALDCGKKRGFTYHSHVAHLDFQDDNQYSSSMMVAASQTDHWSDTHWMRSDIDSFLAREASLRGCELFEETTVESISRDEKVWAVNAIRGRDAKVPLRLRSRWLIDAGGGGDFSSRWLDNHSDDDWMKTKTGSVFGHFNRVGSFQLHTHPATAVEPSVDFHVDDSAQHHVTEEGWLWMLRFRSGVTSVGIVRPTTHFPPVSSSEQARGVWESWMRKYPSIGELLQDSVPTEQGVLSLKWSNRLSRCRRRSVGDGWVLLPTAYGFVDPLHSTGIAHALSGVVRIAEYLTDNSTVDSSSSRRWTEYDRQMRQEVEWLDLLVGGCYQALPSFDKFCAFAAWYFVAAIKFERVMARDPREWTNGYMTSGENTMRAAAEESFRGLSSQGEYEFLEKLRRAISPWNDVGLLEPATGRRIRHTAPPKFASRLHS